MSEEHLQGFKEVARVAVTANLEKAIELKDKIAAMDYEQLHKISHVLRGSAESNGVCGFGCAAEALTSGPVIRR